MPTAWHSRAPGRKIVKIQTDPLPKDEGWRPAEPFIRAARGFPGIYWGYRRVYLTNTDPSISTQIMKCLAHYNQVVKDATFFGGEKVNFVTGELE